MYPSVDEYSAAVLRQVYILYDHGGLSRRALRSQLLESLITWSALSEKERTEPPTFKVTAETIDISFARQVRMSDCVEFQLPLFREVWLLDDDAYRCVVIAAIQRINEEALEEVSLYERVLLEALGTVYGLYDAEDYYRAIVLDTDPRALLKDGWKRGWIWSSEFGYPI